MTIAWRKLRDRIQVVCEPFDNVIIMVSGGVDSCFLSDFVTRNCSFKPILIHFQHGIREDDYKEVQLVSDMATTHDLTFVLGHGSNLKNIKNQESVARNQRWDFVEKYIRELEGKTIVLTAHNLSENIESFFMNSLRGKSTNSLVMKELCDMGFYTKFKPLLDITKDDLIKAARRRRLMWIEDLTNQSTSLNYERNYWRNVIIPEMQKIRNVNRSMKRLMDELSSG